MRPLIGNQIKMKHPKNSQNHAKYDSITHYHYHYHYHYPVSQSFQQQNPQATQMMSLNEVKNPSNTFQFPEQMSFSSEQNEWKRFLNPKVSRMYQEYQLQQSIFSQNNDKFSKHIQASQIMAVRNSSVMHKSGQTRVIGPQNRQLQKLDQLSYLQKKLKGHLQQKNKSQITTLTTLQSLDVQNRLFFLEKQIQRFKNIEQECIYLRQKFYLHTVHRRPE